MLKRERDIRRMASELGLEVVGRRTDGSNHWRFEVRAPNGHSREFKFSTRANSEMHAAGNERADLKRWLREVTPPEVQPKESTVSEHPKADAGQPKQPARKKYTLTEKRHHMSMSDIMAFGRWMSPEKLDASGTYTRRDFMAYASKELGFPVSDRIVIEWLDANQLQIPSRPPKRAPKGYRPAANTLIADIAALALMMLDAVKEVPALRAHEKQLHDIADRYTQ